MCEQYSETALTESTFRRAPFSALGKAYEAAHETARLLSETHSKIVEHERDICRGLDEAGVQLNQSVDSQRQIIETVGYEVCREVGNLGRRVSAQLADIEGSMQARVREVVGKQVEKQIAEAMAAWENVRTLTVLIQRNSADLERRAFELDALMHDLDARTIQVETQRQANDVAKGNIDRANERIKNQIAANENKSLLKFLFGNPKKVGK